MAVMLTVTVVVVVGIAVRLAGWDAASTPPGPLVLSVLVGTLVGYGAVYGGALVYEYGFNVETSGDHPVWHKSEIDVTTGDLGR
jgi:uncharacterized membrane protein